MAVLGWATAASAEPPPLPAPLEGAVVDGEFQPGDLGWLRGRFADATEADKARLTEVKGWLERCRAAATLDAKREVEALGKSADALPQDYYGEMLCAQIGYLVDAPIAPSISFDRFTALLTEARPWVAAYLDGARQVASVRQGMKPSPLQPSITLAAILRSANDIPIDSPKSSDELRFTKKSLVELELIRALRANSGTLENMIVQLSSEHISAINNYMDSDGTLVAALLIARNSRHDPELQLRTVEWIKPVLSKSIVLRKSFAYLTDSVLVTLTGRQKYGTEFAMVAGCPVMAPLADPALVDALRSEAGLRPLADHMEWLRSLEKGDCGP